METKRELRNLKALNIIALLCAAGRFIYVIIEQIGWIVNVDFSDIRVINVIDIIADFVFVTLTIAAVILNFRQKNGSVKATVIAMYLPCLYRVVSNVIWVIRDGLTKKEMDGLLLDFLIIFILCLLVIISAITSFSYIVKPKKIKLVISDIFLLVYLSWNIFQLYPFVDSAIHSSVEKYLYTIILDATLSLVVFFILLVVNLSYKKVKTTNTVNSEITPSNTNVVNNNLPETIRQYKALLDEGIITQEEYEKKKKELLGY